MKFSTIGAQDSLDEAKKRLDDFEILVVWGGDRIIGVLTSENIGNHGSCGSACNLDILIDPSPDKSSKWKPDYVIKTEDGEPVMVSHGP